mgnify:CR=1 FL=1
MAAVPAERLREGSQILVRGKISFSRLARLIEGEALTKSIEQARARGALYPTTVPHTTINLVDAQVLPADPANPSPEEVFVHEKLMYAVKSGENAGKQAFGVDNKSAYLPTVLEQDPENPGQYRQLILERDLATGLDVTVVLEVFKPAGYEKRGIGLQQVVLNEAPKYYSSGVNTSALAARGIVVNGPIRTVAAPTDAAPSDTAAAAAAFAAEADRAGFAVPANSAVSASGLPMPMPGAQGIAPAPTLAQQAFPVSAPAASAPVAAPAFPQAAPVAAPAAPAFPQATAPAAPMETAEQTIARLQAQIAERDAAQAASGGDSAFTPWDVPGQAPAYQG